MPKRIPGSGWVPPLRRHKGKDGEDPRSGAH